MAYTVIQQPVNDINPVYNQIRYVVNSTDYNLTGFRYIAQVKDDSNNILFEKKVMPDPNSNGIFDLNKELSDYCKLDLRNPTVLDATEEYIKYIVEFGQEYLNSIIFTDYEYLHISNFASKGITFNPNNYNNITVLKCGVVQPLYNDGEYINVTFTTPNPTVPEISGIQQILHVYLDGGLWYIALNKPWYRSGPAEGGTITNGDTLKTIQLNQANVSGKSAFNGVIPYMNDWVQNDYTFQVLGGSESKLFLSTLPETGYVIRPGNTIYINILKNSFPDPIGITTEHQDTTTNTIGNDLVNGLINRYKINLSSINPNDDYVHLYCTINSGANQGKIKTKKYKLNIDNNCYVNPIELVYMDDFGSLLPFNFTHINEETHNIKRETYTNNFEKNSNNIFGTNGGGTNIFYSDYEVKYLLRSGYLNKTMAEYFAQLVRSPETYIKIDNKFHKVIINTNTIKLLTDKKGLKQYDITVTLANKNIVNI